MEMKVGALILGALVLLVGFVVLMGGLTLQPTLRVFVDFESPGSLQTGAPVRISGVRVGRVTAIRFQGGQLDAKGKPLPPISVVASIDSTYQSAIHQDARFYVTSQGLLGEMHLAIDPGNYQLPTVEEGDHFLGVSPPRLDQLVGESYELLHRSYVGVTENEEQLSETFEGLHQTLKGSGELVQENKDEISRTIAKVEKLTEKVDQLLTQGQRQYVDGPRVERVLNRIDHSSQVIDENLEPLLLSSRKLLENGNRLAEFLSAPEQIETYRLLTREAKAIVQDGRKVSANAVVISEQIKAGKGSVGALVMDEAIYDDVKELLRDLKHNPWKMMWKP